MQGFVVGTKSGNIHLFEREDEGSYKCTKTFTQEDKHSFKAAASLSDESLVFLTDMGELVKLSVTASSRGKVAFFLCLDPPPSMKPDYLHH